VSVTSQAIMLCRTLALAFVLGVVKSDDHYDQLPQPQAAPFHGRIGLRTNESATYWPSPLEPPAGAPNVLLILIDDAGTN